MAQDGWGAPRIHAELTKLGFIISEITVSRYLPRRPAEPDQLKRWMAFLRNHKDDIAAMDLFTVPTGRSGCCTASSSSSTVVGTSFTSTPRSTRRLLGLFSNCVRRFPTTPLRDISSSTATSSLALRSSSSSRQRAQNPFALRFAAHGKTEPRSGGSAAAVASSLSTSWFSAHVISSGSCELTSATIMRTVATWG